MTELPRLMWFQSLEGKNKNCSWNVEDRHWNILGTSSLIQIFWAVLRICWYSSSTFLYRQMCFVSLFSFFFCTSFLHFLLTWENIPYWIFSKSVQVFRVHQTRCLNKGRSVLTAFSRYRFASDRTRKELVHALSLALNLEIFRYI